MKVYAEAWERDTKRAPLAQSALGTRSLPFAESVFVNRVEDNT